MMVSNTLYQKYLLSTESLDGEQKRSVRAVLNSGILITFLLTCV